MNAFYDLRSTMVLAAGLVAAPALAAPVLDASLSAQAMEDGDVFRLPVGTGAPAGDCRADTIGLGSAKIGYSLSRQTPVSPFATGDYTDWEGRITGSIFRQIFACNRQLDNTGFNGNVNVQSPLLGPFTIAISGQTQRSLTSFNYLSASVKNIQTVVQTDDQFTVDPTPDFRIVVNPTYLSSANSSPLLQPLGFRQYGLGGGIGYFSPTKNEIILEYSQSYSKGVGARPALVSGNVVDLRTNLRDTIYAIKVIYNPSPITVLSGRLAYDVRDDYRALKANYRGWIGNFQMVYAPDDGFRVTVGADQSLSSQTYLFLDGARGDTFSFKLDKAFRSKFKIEAETDYLTQRYMFDPLLGEGAGGTSRQWLFGLSASTKILDRADLALHLSHQTRNLSNVYEPFSDYSAQISLTYNFGNPTCQNDLLNPC